MLSALQKELFEFRDLVCVRGILSLLEQGVPLRRIRRNVEILRDRLPEVNDPLRSLRVWVEGSERMVIRHEGMLLEPSGQMVLDFGQGAQRPAENTPISLREENLLVAEYFERGCELGVLQSAVVAAAIGIEQAANLRGRVLGVGFGCRLLGGGLFLSSLFLDRGLLLDGSLLIGGLLLNGGLSLLGRNRRKRRRIVVAATADQGQAGRADRGAARAAQQRAARKPPSPAQPAVVLRRHAVVTLVLDHCYPSSCPRLESRRAPHPPGSLAAP